MDELKLNKPLYKADTVDESFTPPIPRQPRPSLIGRGAALFLDIMMLHLVMGAIVRFVPAVPLTLGQLAPWVGLAVGYMYFGFGFSHITLGRTLGKLITRVQVADIDGPDLSIGRAFLRAAGLLWPLAVQLVLRMVAEYYGNTNPISIFTSVEIVGTMLILGWSIGNLLFAMFDPFNRTMYDFLAHSVVINAELEPEPIAAYLSDVRVVNQAPPIRKSLTALGISLTICLAFAAASAVALMRQLRDLTPAAKDRVQAMISPNYGRAWPSPPLNENPTTGTIPVAFQFRNRGPIDLSTLKSDPAATATLERLMANATGPEFIDEVKEYIQATNNDRLKRGEGPTSAPTAIQFELSYVEYADLFFAREAHPVYTLSRDITLPTTITTALDETTTK